MQALFDIGVASLESENNNLIDNGKMFIVVFYNDEAVARSILDRWVRYYALIMVRTA